ncbi:hypothetical protein VIGAN_10101500 [Vigna angularis var. angularis]|uniref:Leucine-rich repeat-containing N-terminal plant-type domain-containing protein n=1 Tax=Vigna angularis var. angularis TaxID=157739 RepID=A0A0S3T386_PHAAN|nr:hypothetical protein VIGAN_10101500 [Vigna angularis var. angularis]
MLPGEEDLTGAATWKESNGQRKSRMQSEAHGKHPLELGNLTALRELYIGYYNAYSGGILPEIGNLSQLVRFDAAYCGLSGDISADLGRLQNMDTLFLQVNALSSSLTLELGNLKSLKSMDLSNNVLSGEVPTSFTELKNLTLLNLNRVGVSRQLQLLLLRL